jgi:hypothetical protein
VGKAVGAGLGLRVAVGLNLRQLSMESFHVHPQIVVPGQVDGFPVGLDPGATQGAVEGGQGAAQGGPRPGLVVFGPEQCRQRVASLTLAGDGQVGDEGHCLAAANI